MSNKPFAKIFEDRIELYQTLEELQANQPSAIGSTSIEDDFSAGFVDNINQRITDGELELIYKHDDPTPAKAYLKKQLAAKRYDVEVSGTTWNGFPVFTDRESQGKITAAFVLASAGVRAESSNWKFADGVARPMTNAQIVELTGAVAYHVQHAFDVEATKADEIDATGTTDIDTGW